MTHSIFDFSKSREVLLVKKFVECHFIFEVQYKNKNNSVVNERKTIRSK